MAKDRPAQIIEIEDFLVEHARAHDLLPIRLVFLQIRIDDALHLVLRLS